MTWQCPDCKTTYEYHPPPCPICSANRAAERDESGIRGAAAGIHKTSEKHSSDTELGKVVTWKKQRVEGKKDRKAEGKKGRKRK